MKKFRSIRNVKLMSAASLIMSAAMIFGGTGVHIHAEAEAAQEQVYSEGVGRAAAVPLTAGQAIESREAEFGRNVTMYIDGEKYTGKSFLYKDTTYVGIREFTVKIAGANVSWNQSTSTATAKTRSTTVTAKNGTEYISANGRYLWAKTGVMIVDGTMYVPVRPLATAYGATVSWDGKSYTVSIKRGNGTIKSGSSYYDPDEVYWLSRIIHAESRGEPMSGKIAVGNVVLNRVESTQYPNTIYGVIFDTKYGIQFSPVADGSINLKPGEESVIAAKLCLEGYTVSDSILFFINKSAAANMWVTNNRTHEVSIGRHDFYA